MARGRGALPDPGRGPLRHLGGRRAHRAGLVGLSASVPLGGLADRWDPRTLRASSRWGQASPRWRTCWRCRASPGSPRSSCRHT
ncbi:hypothetical protein DRA43_09835 [Micromonospora provocatoris]|nr:hypothetical protein DRA43_09835 [Micromonospora provocatoris]